MSFGGFFVLQARPRRSLGLAPPGKATPSAERPTGPMGPTGPIEGGPSPLAPYGLGQSLWPCPRRVTLCRGEGPSGEQ